MQPASSSSSPLADCFIDIARRQEISVSENLICSHNGNVPPASISELISVAGRLGFAVRSTARLNTLRPTDLPALVKAGDRVFVVHEMRVNDLGVFDPEFGAGMITIRRQDIEKDVEAVLVFKPEYKPRQGPAHDEERPGKSWFWSALLKNKWSYFQVVLASAVSNILTLSTSIFTMVVYDRILPTAAMESLTALTFGVVIALVFDFLIRWIRSSFLDSSGLKADLAMGQLIFQHLLNIQMKLKRESSGQLASVVREFESLRDFFTSASMVTIVDLPFVFLFLFVIHEIGGPIVTAPLLALPATLTVVLLIQPFLSRLAEKSFREGKTKQGVLVEALSGMETIKTVGAASFMSRRWEDAISHHGEYGNKSRALIQFGLNFTAFIQQAAQIGVVCYGVLLVKDNVITSGALIASVILTGRTLAPLAQVAHTMIRLNNALISYRSINRLMRSPGERDHHRRYISKPRLSGKVEFRGVSFRYPDQASPVLDNVSFVIEPGEKVALLGRIGSGKSTIARLLLGLYEPEQGSVLIDDIDIRQLDPTDLRYNIGSVLQDIWLFTGSVKQNIAIGGLNPSDAEVLQASRTAGVHDFIGHVPNGYDLVLSERGEGLSGGQRQSIAIARALVKQAPLLVLDEPTSMMDLHTETSVLTRMRDVLQDSTFLIITHRGSVLELVDRVIVVDGGKVIADGPKSILNQPRPVPAPGSQAA